MQTAKRLLNIKISYKQCLPLPCRMRFSLFNKKTVSGKIAYGRALGVAFAYKTILCLNSFAHRAAAKLKFSKKVSPAGSGAVKNCIEKNNGAAIRASAREKIITFDYVNQLLSKSLGISHLINYKNQVSHHQKDL